MKNLAGVKSEESTPATIDELEAAGVPVIPAPDRSGEVLSNAAGRLEAAGHVFIFRRLWVYWVVEATPPLPASMAVALNSAPFAGEGARYSGSAQTLGAVARARGFAGGMDSKQIEEWGACHSWHIDTPEALAAFVAWVKTSV